MLNPFFKNVGPFSIEKLLSKTNIENKENFKKDRIYNVSDLINATDKDLTFFHSKNYCKKCTIINGKNYQRILSKINC